jgi:hypothetical protein
MRGDERGGNGRKKRKLLEEMRGMRKYQKGIRGEGRVSGERRGDEKV